MKRSYAIAFMLTVLYLISSVGINATPVFASDSPLKLDQCLELAYRNSPSLESAHQDILSAKAGVLGACGSFLPMVNSSAGYNHQFMGPRPGAVQYDEDRQEYYTQPPTPSHDIEGYSFSFSSDITLFSGFSRWARLSAQRSTLKAAESDIETTRDDVESQVIRAYFDLVKAQMLVESNQSSLESSATQFEQSKRAFMMGAVARSDTLRSRVRYSEVQLNLLEAQNTRDVANVALATLIGFNPSDRIEVAVPAVGDFISINRDEAINSALRTNPALVAAGYRVDASKQGVRQAKAGYWPSVSASYSYSWSDYSPPDDIGKIFDDKYNYVLSMRMNWNIFDRFTTKTGIAQAKASSRVQEYNLELQKRTLVQSVESTLVTLHNNHKRIELASQNLELAREDLRLAQERYRVGAAAILEVTEAEVSLVQARASEIEGITGYLAAAAELERISGLKILQ
ncbi:MAG: TolC family protein [bacterium]|nr:TolC family protein [bacterium]